jgi:diguanylate cyclase (GGDEF)-like protein
VVLEKKNREDELRNADITRKIENLRDGLQQMKTEADSARQKIGKLKKQLLVDPLTGAFNRKAYDDRIGEELERYLRYHRIFSLLLFDIDHFKIVNDRYGHAIGDKCLKEITRHGQSLLRQNDMLFRIGGEEFVIILPETDIKGASRVAEKLRSAIENIEFIMKEETLKITISIGLTMVNAQDKNVSNLFDRVDAAMYDAKQKGRNCVVRK